MSRIARAARVPVVSLTLLLFAVAPALAQRAVIIVRHAEKVDQSADAALSAAGQARARALAALLAKAGVTAVYATQYRRTVQTVQPLADALGLRVQTRQADDSAGLVARLRSHHASDVVLVAGHSNTVPEVLRLLGDTAPTTIADDDFGSLFVVVPRPGAAPVVLRLHY
jgi:broad specificity phosphatase PhoE